MNDLPAWLNVACNLLSVIAVLWAVASFRRATRTVVDCFDWWKGRYGSTPAASTYPPEWHSVAGQAELPVRSTFPPSVQ